MDAFLKTVKGHPIQPVQPHVLDIQGGPRQLTMSITLMGSLLLRASLGAGHAAGAGLHG
ncbi:MAG: hypothetical protein K9K65_15785 [Desulfarculaceae bacterium]|nr:hypothetical protein [Desulfarculaceae bacterium]MCF8046749.1 hypothetical protein [Desulfarculaceae bacterium]MCF8099299.1 hypothetical protein [Desulfarculaceae bacterium]MCF8124527.1 hypothetical protein [Desulfarculaceae bacterium]